MRRIAILGVWLAMVACNADRAVDPTPLNPTPDPIAPPTPPPVTPPNVAIFKLGGTVRTDEGLLLPATRVQMIDPRERVFETATNDSGYFEFTVIGGGVRLLVTREGYYTAFQTVQVGQNVTVTVLIQRATDSSNDELPEAEVRRFTVTHKNPPCDPVGWDAMAPCRSLKFYAQRSGTLTIQLTWSGYSELDAVIMSTAGAYLAYSTGRKPLLLLRYFVFGGSAYEIRVHSYYGAETFDLRADIQP